MRQEYWQEVADIDLENLVFIEAMGILLDLARPTARALPGARAHDFKPFYRGSKVSVIGAITSSKVLAIMTIDKSMNSDIFEVYISKLLVPQLWLGAVVVMDNLPAHKVETIATFN